MMQLHILNGDCALKGWKECNFSGEALVWRENYLQGVIPEVADIEHFNRIRAEELHKMVPQRSADDIFSELQMMHQKLFALRSMDKLILWLDCCPFDQALKNHLIELISSMPELPKLYLVQQDVVWNKDSFELYTNWENYPYKL